MSGGVGVWVSGCVGIWVSGSECLGLGVWVPGCLGPWVSGCLGMWARTQGDQVVVQVTALSPGGPQWSQLAPRGAEAVLSAGQLGLGRAAGSGG